MMDLDVGGAVHGHGGASEDLGDEGQGGDTDEAGARERRSDGVVGELSLRGILLLVDITGEDPRGEHVVCCVLTAVIAECVSRGGDCVARHESGLPGECDARLGQLWGQGPTSVDRSGLAQPRVHFDRGQVDGGCLGFARLEQVLGDAVFDKNFVAQRVAAGVSTIHQCHPSGRPLRRVAALYAQ